jgi:hypothetical protein
MHAALDRYYTDLISSRAHDARRVPVDDAGMSLNARKIAKPGRAYILGEAGAAPEDRRRVMADVLAHEAAADAREAGWSMTRRSPASHARHWSCPNLLRGARARSAWSTSPRVSRVVGQAPVRPPGEAARAGRVVRRLLPGRRTRCRGWRRRPEEFRRILKMTRSNYMGLVVDATAERCRSRGSGSGTRTPTGDVADLAGEQHGLGLRPGHPRGADPGCSYLMVEPNREGPGRRRTSTWSTRRRRSWSTAGHEPARPSRPG